MQICETASWTEFRGLCARELYSIYSDEREGLCLYLPRGIREASFLAELRLDKLIP